LTTGLYPDARDDPCLRLGDDTTDTNPGKELVGLRRRRVSDSSVMRCGPVIDGVGNDMIRRRVKIMQKIQEGAGGTDDAPVSHRQGLPANLRRRRWACVFSSGT
jgi:hypothetical protein